MIKEEKSLLNENILSLEGKKIDIKGEDFKKILFLYKIALREMETRINIIKDEYDFLYNYCIIDHIKTRLKKPDSIVKKLENKKIEMNYQKLIDEISDIAGIRIICPVKENIFDVLNIIKSYPDIKVLKEKDYISNPKKSGYSSYHIILEVPINVAGKIINIKTEIQIRTMAMDFWASLEHKIKYKTDKEVTKKMCKELINAAKILNKMDVQMAEMLP